MARVNKFKDKLFYRRFREGYFQVWDDGVITNRYGKVLGTQNSRDYITIGLKFRGKLYLLQAHRLVWMAFNGRIPDGFVPNHINEVKNDNRLSNLELLSNGDNTRHTLRRNPNLVPRGCARPNAKVVDGDVIRIRRLYAKGLTQKRIGEKLNYPKHVVGGIVRGQFYTHV